MAFRVKRTIDTTTSTPTGIPSFSRISQMVKKLINASQYDYHESETFEVKEVFLNEPFKGYGAVTGTFINNPNQEILGGAVLPLMPNITNIPVIGEHVVVTEYNGQHYYTSIVNRKNSPNENAIPGASGIYEKDTKYGDTFERKDIRRVEVNEGEIVYEGRFGNSIKLGCDHTNNSPIIKIRAGQQTLNAETKDVSGKPVKESIDNDASSIYLISDGLVGQLVNDEKMFGDGENKGEQIKGKKILIKSDGIFISGRDNLKLRAVNNININTPVLDIISDDIKLGSTEPAKLQPVVKGDDLKSILEDIASILKLYPTLINNAQVPVGTTDPTVVSKIPGLSLKINRILSTKVKTI